MNDITTDLRLPKKSARRNQIIDGLLAAMSDEYIYKTLDYQNRGEDYLKQAMHQKLLTALEGLHRTLNGSLKPQTIVRKAKDSLLWEGDKNTTINHIRFLGVQHRPDFKVLIDDLRIAVEVKRGENGSAVREGIGQSLVYACSKDFDFVVYVFVDTSKDKKIREATLEPREQAFIESLWAEYNVRFAVVTA